MTDLPIDDTPPGDPDVTRGPEKWGEDEEDGDGEERD